LSDISVGEWMLSNIGSGLKSVNAYHIL